MSLTLGEASKQSGFAKSSLSQAVSKGRLAAVRRQNGSFAIDEAELARFVEANAPPVRVGSRCWRSTPGMRRRWHRNRNRSGSVFR